MTTQSKSRRPDPRLAAIAASMPTVELIELSLDSYGVPTNYTAVNELYARRDRDIVAELFIANEAGKRTPHAHDMWKVV